MKIFEWILLSIVAIGFVMYMTLTASGGIILIAMMGALSAFYFWFGFPFFNNIPFSAMLKANVVNNMKAKYVIIGLLCGVNLAILIMGTLFSLMNWPGNEMMLISSMIPALIFIAYGIFSTKKSSQRLLL